VRRRTWALGCLLTALLPAAPAAASGCAARTTAIRYGRWFTSRPPMPPRPAAHQQVHPNAVTLESVALDPADGRIVLASDGLRLYRSDDGGCRWTQVYALADLPGLVPDGLTGSIEAVDVARVGGRTRVILAVHVRGDHAARTGVRTVIVRSDDGYTGWTVVDDPLTFLGASVVGWRPMLRSVGNVVYAAFPWLTTGLPAYARSVDGGRTWALRSRTGLDGPPYLESLWVNPWNPDELWEANWGANGTQDPVPPLRRSTDGGATWTYVDPWRWYPGGEASGSNFDIAWPRRGGPARILALGTRWGETDEELNLVAWSGDGGASFHLVLLPRRGLDFAAPTMTHLGNGDVVIILSTKDVFLLRHSGRPPRLGDWRVLRKIPLPPACGVMERHCARAPVAGQAVVSFPTTVQAQFLVVR